MTQSKSQIMTQTITTTITDLPLSKLTHGKANVRKTNSGSLEPLIASLRAHGLIQNLTVRPILNKKGHATGRYSVVAGNRRLSALQALAETGEIDGDTPLPCHVLDEADDTEIGLAENVMRVAMHPADQFTAFNALAQAGTSAEDIAARFGVTALFVKQRLKLARVSPALFETYREGGMTLDQLMAFTLVEDHAEQDRVWEALPTWNRNPSTIRRALTTESVPATDRRVTLVGLDRYEAAGGNVQRDLFDDRNQGYLTDPALLAQLVHERLDQEATALTAAGWAWAKTMVDIDHNAFSEFTHSYPETVALSEADQAALDAATEAYDTLLEDHDDEPEDEAIGAEIDRLSDEIDRLTALRQHWSDEVKASHGCIVCLEWDGSLRVVEGLAERQDEPASPAPANDTQANDEGSDSPAPQAKLSPKLKAELIAHRTAAIRAELLERPDLALIVTVHRLALAAIYAQGSRSCVALRAESDDLKQHGDSVAANPGLTAMHDAQDRWQRWLPAKAPALWDWLLSQEQDTCLELLAYLTASAIEPAWIGDPAKRHADQLAETLTLDMTQYWQADPDTFFGKVTKATILDAVQECVSPEAAENLASLKKDALIQHAVERMTGKGWLPAPLRKLDTPDTALAA